MPEWKPEIRERLAKLQLAPERESAIVEELSQHLDYCYRDLLSGGATEAEAEMRTLAELSDREFLAREVRRVDRWHRTRLVLRAWSHAHLVTR